MTDLDEALERFQARGFEFGGGLSNHGPMAAEALLRLGHPALLSGFVEVYEPRLGSQEPGRWIPKADRAAALGRSERLGDWRATFEREIAEGDWREVVQRGTALLADGFFAAGTHGALRLAHAVRAADEDPTTPRLREVAFGLAYWAGCYQVLPGRPGRDPREGKGPRRVLSETTVVDSERRRAGFFTDTVRVLDEDPVFTQNIENMDLDDSDLSSFLGELCRESARLYLENPQSRIAYVHALTAPSAVRLLASCLDVETRVRVAGRALQAASALHAVSGGDCSPALADEVQQIAEDPALIRYRAACSLDEHAIKFSEACLREDALRPDPIFRLAAADAAVNLQGSALC
jgi:hypothetical protein